MSLHETCATCGCTVGHGCPESAPCMCETDEATPRPWYHVTGNLIRGSHGECIAGDSSFLRNPGNATLIVRAVNAHDAMREALRPFTTVPCEYQGNIHCTMLPADSGKKICAPCAARAALALADGDV